MPTSTAALIGELPAVEGGSPVFEARFRFIQPTLPSLDRVLAHYHSAYAEGLITNSDLVARLEAAAAARLGVNHIIAVSSCTSGLIMVLRALGLSGEVILPSFTFFATGHAVLWNGLRPVFADCDRQTWTIDPVDVERKITERTSAILAVHLYGNPCDIEALASIASRHRLKLIFDAAHAFGSQYGGRPIGQFGDAEVFSLSPTKLLVAGEGGLVATNDRTLARLIRAARNYGDLGAYDCEVLGLNARMSEFHAALALAGLEMVDAKVRRHNEIAANYTALLASVRGLSFQTVSPHHTCAYKDYSVLVDHESCGLSRDQLAQALLAENIETKKYFYPPLHKQKLYAEYYDTERDGLSLTNRISGGILSLPIYESMPETTVERIAFAIQRILKSPR